MHNHLYRRTGSDCPLKITRSTAEPLLFSLRSDATQKLDFSVISIRQTEFLRTTRPFRSRIAYFRW
jgi:hypothetical protein